MRKHLQHIRLHKLNWELVQGRNVERESVSDPRPGEVDGQAVAHLCKQRCHRRRAQRGGRTWTKQNQNTMGLVEKNSIDFVWTSQNISLPPAPIK